MFIVINCLGMPFNGETIKGSSLGGSETAAYYVAKELSRLGHKVTVFTTSEQEGVWDGVKYVHAGHMTEATPLGDRFHFYAENTPHDVLIIQRHPSAFRFNWQAKVKLWWLHDLAQISRLPEVQSHIWNMDGILTVSEMHKQQIAEVYGINPDIIYPIQNGVDLSLFEGDVNLVSSKLSKGEFADIGKERLLYTSRPERGLEHLVAPEGIMERLAEVDSKYHLYVCAYQNTTEQMAPYYNYLNQRVEELPNVTNLGSLTKQQLADVMRQCDALVYPTPGPQQPNFDEVSCITAMEAMAAGLPFISTKRGALLETCKDSGSILLEPDGNGMPNLQDFVDHVIDLFDKGHYNDLGTLCEKQLRAAKRYDWEVATLMLENVIDTCFKRNRSNGAMARHMLETSDIYALDKFSEKFIGTDDFHEDEIFMNAYSELNECYMFAFQNTWEEHYKKVYVREEERGVNYGPENLDGNDRFEYVSNFIRSNSTISTVLDYGCAHGHYTVNLAKRFPEKTFIGVDITKSNVEKANRWCEQEGIDNVSFIHGTIPQLPESGEIRLLSGEEVSLTKYDCVIAAEVIEHIGNPAYYVDTLCKYLSPEGKMIITTPYGPWEAIGYKEHHPWRAHVHHFDREDLSELWGHFPAYSVAVAPSGASKWSSAIGSYITTFDNPGELKSKTINYERKFEELVPRQTVTLCMIAKDAEDTIKRSLDSAQDVVDEVIIAVDRTTTDRTRQVIDNWVQDRKGNWPVVKVISVKSPLEIGFDEARNESIKEASGDWILWMDSDETLIHPQNLYKYLQNNAFNGYAIKQHHFAVEPLGVLKTDLPCRLFRNHKGIKFFGVVHEHPETALNKGAGHVQLLPDVEIAHHGYTTEAVRRKRFDRNIGLLVRDREKYPERELGKFLWMRDLSQMTRYELERNGGRITSEMRARAEQGIAIWEELLEQGQLRMIVDGMDFYSLLAKVKGGGFEAGFVLDTSKLNGGLHMEQAKPVQAHFASKKHAMDLFKAVFDEKVKSYDSKYF